MLREIPSTVVESFARRYLSQPEEVDQATQITKKVKGGDHSFSKECSLPTSYEDVVAVVDESLKKTDSLGDRGWRNSRF